MANVPICCSTLPGLAVHTLLARAGRQASYLGLKLEQPCAQRVNHLINLVHPIPAQRLGELKLADVPGRQRSP